MNKGIWSTVTSVLTVNSQNRKERKKNQRKEKKNCFTNILYKLIPPHLITDVPCAGNIIILKQDTRTGKNNKISQTLAIKVKDGSIREDMFLRRRVSPLGVISFFWPGLQQEKPGGTLLLREEAPRVLPLCVTFTESLLCPQCTRHSGPRSKMKRVSLPQMTSWPLITAPLRLWA